MTNDGIKKEKGTSKILVKGVKKTLITGEFIRLDALLKYASIASTGGEAKILIQNGEVLVNGEPCNVRGKKIRQGDTVRYGGETLVVMSRGETPNLSK